jgi:hypothetical protein
MTTYFVFSDENGEYKPTPNAHFCGNYPFYIRSAVILDVESWTQLKNQFTNLKLSYELPVNKEIKWSYLWSLTKQIDNLEVITPDKPYYFLKDYKLSRLKEFVGESCKLLCSCPLCKIVLTVTFNETENSWSKYNIQKMHLQEIMQRIEMDLHKEDNNLAVIFFDATSQDVDKLLREAYNDLYYHGDFIKKYSHIKDSISFELSHHSFGIQLADYVAGSFNGSLHDYQFSKNLFRDYLYQLLRREETTNKILGYGIREVPSSADKRSWIEEKLNKLETDY